MTFKKTTKRLVSGLIAIALAFTILPTSVFAANDTAQPKVAPMPSSQTAVPDPIKGEAYPKYDEAGYVNIAKSASWTDGATKTKANVVFDLFGTGVPSGVDAVVVLDRSGSMANRIATEDCTGTYERKGSWIFDSPLVKMLHGGIAPDEVPPDIIPL